MLFDEMVDGEDNLELFEDIMEEFIYEIPAGKNQAALERAIQGRGAFYMRKQLSKQQKSSIILTSIQKCLPRQDF